MDYEKKLKQLINDGNNMIKNGVVETDPRLESWKTQVSSLLSNKFGKDSEEYKAFKGRFVATPIAGKNSSKPKIPLDELQATVYELKSYVEDMDL